MLDALEIRLADLLADALVGVDNLGPVGRIGVESEPDDGDVGIVVGVDNFSPRPHVGDDRRSELREAGQIRLRPTLHLEGEARIALTSIPPDGDQETEARARLIEMMDRVLLALHPEAMRTGRAFDTGADQGFELSSFRFSSAGSLPDALAIELVYGFEGRFWPVGEAPEGDVITTLPTRLTVMPVRLPDRIVARAGGSDLTVPIQLDLSATGGAASAIAARLEGSAPPGRAGG